MAKSLNIIFLWLALFSSAIADVQVITNGKSLAISCQQALIALDKGLDHVEPDNQYNAFICFSYIGGVIGAAGYTEALSELKFALATSSIVKERDKLGQFKKPCIDWNIQNQEAAQIVLNFAQQNPDELGEPAYSMVLHALQSAFPCR